MTAYIFETIGVAQALAYDAATDSLIFSASGSSAGNIQVAFDSGTLNVAVTSGVTGRTVVFGQDFGGEFLTGGAGNDLFITHAGESGDQMILVGVTFANFPPGWIFAA